MAGLIIGELATGGERSVDAAVAFLLYSLPASRVVQLGVHPSPKADGPTYGPKMMLTNAMIAYKLDWYQPDNTFEVLETIKYCGRPANYYDLESAHLEDRIKLFELPNIKSITLCLADQDVNPRWSCDILLPTPRALSLQFSNINLHDLENLLARAPHLQHSKYHFRGELSNLRRRSKDRLPLERRLLACGMLRRAIEVRADTLEQLSLSIGFHDCGDKDNTPENLDNARYGIIGSLGDVTAFKTLRSLTAPTVMLLGWKSLSTPIFDEILPTGLR
ncbi:MAG: hypothetical protein L6R41_003062 [Letrouitia leprolyta]|nr:MAG: hypothetical protein L6R41_003062 [Letrouitia leprolyta]